MEEAVEEEEPDEGVRDRKLKHPFQDKGQVTCRRGKEEGMRMSMFGRQAGRRRKLTVINVCDGVVDGGDHVLLEQEDLEAKAKQELPGKEGDNNREEMGGERGLTSIRCWDSQKASEDEAATYPRRPRIDSLEDQSRGGHEIQDVEKLGLVGLSPP